LNNTYCENLKVTYVQKYIEQVVLKRTTNFIPLLGMSSSPEDLVDLKFTPLNTELNPICYLPALLGAHPIFHISRIRVKSTSNTKVRNTACNK
jgi:hypothetical protein